MEIIMDKRQTKSMMDAKEFLDSVNEFGKSGGLNDFEIEEMIWCYNDIIRTIEHYGETISENVAYKFKKFGFRVRLVEPYDEIPHWHIYIFNSKFQNKLNRRAAASL